MRESTEGINSQLEEYHSAVDAAHVELTDLMPGIHRVAGSSRLRERELLSSADFLAPPNAEQIDTEPVARLSELVGKNVLCKDSHGEWSVERIGMIKFGYAGLERPGNKWRFVSLQKLADFNRELIGNFSDGFLMETRRVIFRDFNGLDVNGLLQDLILNGERRGMVDTGNEEVNVELSTLRSFDLNLIDSKPSEGVAAHIVEQFKDEFVEFPGSFKGEEYSFVGQVVEILPGGQRAIVNCLLEDGIEVKITADVKSMSMLELPIHGEDDIQSILKEEDRQARQVQSGGHVMTYAETINRVSRPEESAA